MKTENNKLIAIFMESAITDNYGNYKETYLYDKDWNKLMEVIKKIVELGIFVRYDSNKFYKLISKFQIESSCKACVDFIKWNNEQNRK